MTVPLKRHRGRTRTRHGQESSRSSRAQRGSWYWSKASPQIFADDRRWTLILRRAKRLFFKRSLSLLYLRESAQIRVHLRPPLLSSRSLVAALLGMTLRSSSRPSVLLSAFVRAHALRLSPEL